MTDQPKDYVEVPHDHVLYYCATCLKPIEAAVGGGTPEVVILEDGYAYCSTTCYEVGKPHLVAKLREVGGL